MPAELEPPDPGDLARRAAVTAARAAARAAAAADWTAQLPRGLGDPIQAFRESNVADPRTVPVALVLAGGGAKGAYQGGVARFLAEAGTPVAAISGASIGALNGAILASAPSLQAGAERIMAAWTDVARQTGEPRFGSGSGAVVDVVPQGSLPPEPLLDEATTTQVLNLWPRLRGPMFEPGFLDQLLSRYVDVRALAGGVDFWISVFPAVNPSIGGLESLLRGRRRGDGADRAALHPRFGWLLDVVRAKVLGTRSKWLLVKELPPGSAHDAILGSAALPIVLPPRVVSGKTYRDGGFADNLPIGALYSATNIRRMVVVHLQPYPLFDEGEFPGCNIIEVIPSRPISPGGPLGSVSGLVDLSPRRVAALFELGYNDARQQLERVWRREGIAAIADFSDGFRRAAVAELDDPLV